MEAAIVEFATGKCKCAGEMKALKEELAVCSAKNEVLSAKLTEQQQQPCAPFCEQSLVDDSQVRFFTSSPNLHILKSILTIFTRQCQWNRLTTVHVCHAEALVKQSSTKYSLPLSGFTVNSIMNSFKMACADGCKTHKIDSGLIMTTSVKPCPNVFKNLLAK